MFSGYTPFSPLTRGPSCPGLALRVGSQDRSQPPRTLGRSLGGCSDGELAALDHDGGLLAQRGGQAQERFLLQVWTIYT